MEFLGYKMTKEQKQDLLYRLQEEIIDRYNNIEYWDLDIVEDYAKDNNLSRTKEK